METGKIIGRKRTLREGEGKTLYLSLIKGRKAVPVES